MSVYLVDIGIRRGLFDASAREVLTTIGEMGFPQPQEVRVSHLYRLQGRIDPAAIRYIIRELLLDPISQECAVNRPLAGRTMPRVDVWYRQGVTDTVAETTVRAIADMGIRQTVRVATGMRYSFQGNCDRGYLEKIGLAVLANTLVQDIDIWRPPGD